MPEMFFSYHCDVQEKEPQGQCELLQVQMHVREKFSTGWNN